MRAVPRPDWSARTVVCLASGPSLTQDDVAAVLESGHPVIVTNTTFRIAPWSNVLFGFDARWWREHVEEVQKVFKGRTFCGSPLAAKYGITSLDGVPWFKRYGNSGACSISLAVSGGAKRVVMLGFDCCTGDDPARKWHWHGDHPNKMSNCLSMAKWPYQFAKLADWCRQERVQVINASRRTALTCFERKDLGDAL